MLKKYIFYCEEDKIYTYSFSGTEFNLKKNDGEDYTSTQDLSDVSFNEWLQKIVSETDDDFIDFCVLSDKKISCDCFATENNKWKKQDKSAWSLKNVYDFLKDESFSGFCYELVMTGDGMGFSIKNGLEIKKLYLKCFPEFDFENKEKLSLSEETTSEQNIEQVSVSAVKEQMKKNDLKPKENSIKKEDPDWANYLANIKRPSGYKPKIKISGSDNAVATEVVQLRKIEDIEKLPKKTPRENAADQKVKDETSNSGKELFAVFYDAENIAFEYCDGIENYLKSKGKVIYRCTAGDFSNIYVKDWKKLQKNYHFEVFQQVEHFGKPEAADHFLKVKIAEYLNQSDVNATVVIVSSDGDFSTESGAFIAKGKKIIGIGLKNIKASYSDSCTDFLFLEDIVSDFESIAKTVKERESKIEQFLSNKKEQNKFNKMTKSDFKPVEAKKAGLRIPLDLQEKIYKLFLENCGENNLINFPMAGAILKNNGIDYKGNNPNLKLTDFLQNVQNISIMIINNNKYIKVIK